MSGQPVVIVPLSLYLQNNQRLTIDAFKALGISSWQIFWHSLPLRDLFFHGSSPYASLNAVFDQYKLGKLTNDEFRKAIHRKFPNADLSKKKFEAAWNKMQVVNDLTHNMLNEVEELNQKKVNVTVLSSTNDLHYKDLLKKLNRNKLPGRECLSFQQKLLGDNLTEILFCSYKKNDKIKMFYTEPAECKPRLNIFNWFFDYMFRYRPAKNYTNRLKAMAKEYHVELIEFKANADNQPNILSSLKMDNKLAKGVTIEKSNVLTLERKRQTQKQKAAPKRTQPKRNYKNILKI